MRKFLRQSALCIGIVAVSVGVVRAKSGKALRIYFIDVEGGQSTLIVTPSKQSLLIDAGWAGTRDPDRILAAASEAGIKQIDYLVVTHYHGDHAGGVSQLAERIPIRNFIDHGPDIEDSATAKDLYAAYEKTTAKGKHAVVRPADGLPLKDVQVEFVSAAGDHLRDPLPGAGVANPYCDVEKDVPDDATENSQSLGMLITYGEFRFLDVGDLTEKKELELVCPNNLIGAVSLYLSAHHGLAPDNPKALVWAIHPMVAIMNNGAHKGGSPESWQIVHDSPDLQGFWQMHYAEDAGQEHNVAESFIANVDEKSDGNLIEVLANSDGTFEVRNSRNHYSHMYKGPR